MHSKLFETPFGGLKITSDQRGFFDTNVLTPCVYKQKLLKDEYEILIQHEMLHTSDSTYRAGTFDNGLYLGHHMGKPGRLKVDEKSISISIANSTEAEQRKVLWSYALKHYFTVMAQSCNALHIKAATVLSKNEKAILIVGRGGSGKTTLSKALDSKGMNVLGNTHAIVYGGKVWPISTWIRERDESNKSIYNAAASLTLDAYDIDRIICVGGWNNNDQFKFEALSKKDAYSYMLYYSLATINYDLKEDLFDYYKTQNLFASSVSDELTSLQRLVFNTPCFNIDWDSNGVTSMGLLFDHLEDA